MPNSFKNFLLYPFPLIVYCTAIFFSSSMPSALPQSDAIPNLDKLVHVLAYAPMGILFLRFFRFSGIKYAVILSIVAASCYGASDEIHQYFVPSRVCDFWDWLSDSVGGAIGVLAYYKQCRSK